jgi:hypothetical protein
MLVEAANGQNRVAVRRFFLIAATRTLFPANLPSPFQPKREGFYALLPIIK